MGQMGVVPFHSTPKIFSKRLLAVGCLLDNPTAIVMGKVIYKGENNDDEDYCKRLDRFINYALNRIRNPIPPPAKSILTKWEKSWWIFYVSLYAQNTRHFLKNARLEQDSASLAIKMKVKHAPYNHSMKYSFRQFKISFASSLARTEINKVDLTF